MSLQYVTLTEQKNYSQILHTGRDDTITLLIQAASSQVKEYLKNFSPYEGERNSDDDYYLDSNFEPEIALDSNGSQAIQPRVKLAVMMLVDIQLWPERHPKPIEGQGRLPTAVETLLYPLRDPALK
jgi:hypothetical protein